MFPDGIKLAPSILAADMAHLADQVAAAIAAGADRIHVDVMDGHFVPNISFGPVIVRGSEPVASIPLEVHLMISEPDRYLAAFAEAGADTLIVHEEGAIHLNRTVQEIHRLGLQAGVAINPATPAIVLEEILPDLELVLVMTVNPGFGGQEFLAGTLPKIRRVRRMIDDAQRLRAGGRRRNRATHGAPGRRGRRPGPRRRLVHFSRYRGSGGRHGPARGDRPAGTADRLAVELLQLDRRTITIQDYGPHTKGIVIGGLGILHVFLGELAAGGGLFLCYLEWLRRTGRSRSAGRFMSGHFQALVLVSFVLAAVTGLAMWIASIQAPAQGRRMVDEFHWLWATAWTLLPRAVSGYAFLRYKDRLSGRGRLLLLVLYTAAAWFSLFWISGTLSFELTRGPVGRTHNVWTGFFNASFWPSLMFRTVAAMAIAALASCVVINVASSLEQQARHELIGHATRFLVPLVVMPLVGVWFLTSIAPDNRPGVLGANVTTTTFVGIGIGGSLLMGGYALGVLWYQRFYLDGIAAAVLCAMALAATAGGEFVRESVRQPCSIDQALDNGSSLHADLAVVNHLFPFGFPWPTALYLTLFIVTAAVYMVFMNYVLAGAIVLLLGYLAPGARKRSGGGPGEPVRSGLGLISQVVRDWLPAVLGLTVVTGIAPLLFVQILYTRQFYTANQFLFNRFVMLLPVLFVACFMLYLVKSQILAGRRAIWKGPVAIVAFACFSYTAWAWTENHVLSLHEESWKHYYTYFPYLYRNAEISPRLGYWLTASFPTLALAVAWQLHWGRRFHDPVNLDLAARRLRSLAILGLAMSAAKSGSGSCGSTRPHAAAY